MCGQRVEGKVGIKVAPVYPIPCQSVEGGGMVLSYAPQLKPDVSRTSGIGVEVGGIRALCSGDKLKDSQDLHKFPRGLCWL